MLTILDARGGCSRMVVANGVGNSSNRPTVAYIAVAIPSPQGTRADVGFMESDTTKTRVCQYLNSD